jgi:flavin reductase (DIM6/NTAB) family NADH-FMN oxidoreductase RutF
MTSPSLPPEPVRAVDPASFRAVLGRFASGVTIITVTASDGTPRGFTASSFSSVSLTPPIVSFCIGEAASAWPAVSTATSFAVHLLAEDQEELSTLFATSGAERFGPSTRWSPGVLGAPILEGVLAHLECQVQQVVTAGDHHIVLGTPLDTSHQEERHPLLYFRGAYRRLAS